MRAINPDEGGRFGDYGGRYAPETLMPCLRTLERTWREARDDAHRLVRPVEQVELALEELAELRLPPPVIPILVAGPFLLEEIQGSEPQGADGVRDTAIGRQQDPFHRPARRAHLLQEIEGVAIGQAHIRQDHQRVHFGLGPEIRAERVRVRWPDGSWQRFIDLPTDREVTLVQGEHASWGEHASRGEQPASHRSPNWVHPIPIMATSSFIPCPIYSPLSVRTGLNFQK